MEEPDIVTVLIPLPTSYNPDERGWREPVEDEKFRRTADEIAIGLQEGGILRILREGNPQGIWWDRGVLHRDPLAILEVDMRDTPENWEWLKSYAKQVLLDRFRQRAIYLKLVRPIERLLVAEERVSRSEGAPDRVAGQESEST